MHWLSLRLKRGKSIMLNLIFLSLSLVFAATQNVEVHLTSQKKLNFEFETYDNGLIHLKSFQASPEGAELTYLDVQFLKLKNNAQTELEQKTIDFVHKHIPVNEKLTSYTSAKPLKWTEICEKIGQDHTGEFTDEAETLFTMTARVGEKSSRCFGRCGFGCGVPFDNKNRFTQECLNHDLCNRELGENMGPCKDEYWAAADGYLNAKICEKKPK